MVFAFFCWIPLLLLWNPADSSAAPRGSRECAAHVRTTLARQLAAEGVREDLWGRSEPFVVGNSKNGEPLYLTFSNDSELPTDDLYRLVMSSDSGRRAMRKWASEIGPLSVEKLGSALKVSEKQLRQFALRRDATSGQVEYFLDELNPSYFAKFIEDPEYSALGFNWLKKKLVADLQGEVAVIFRERGFPFKAYQDGQDLEVSHLSSESSPETFARLMRRLHAELKAPQSHFHLGIPAEAVDAPHAEAVAKALETKIVLSMAADSSEPGSVLAFNSSVLRGERRRGPVFLKTFESNSWGDFSASQFTEPFPAHDLELRQHEGVENALSLVQFATRLVQNQKRLVLRSQPLGERNDPHIGNIEGALLHAGTLLRDRGARSAVPEQREIGDRMIALAARTRERKQPELDSALRTEIYRFLNQNRVRELLDEELFLQPEARSASERN